MPKATRRRGEPQTCRCRQDSIQLVKLSLENGPASLPPCLQALARLQADKAMLRDYLATQSRCALKLYRKAEAVEPCLATCVEILWERFRDAVLEAHGKLDALERRVTKWIIRDIKNGTLDDRRITIRERVVDGVLHQWLEIGVRDAQ